MLYGIYAPHSLVQIVLSYPGNFFPIIHLREHHLLSILWSCFHCLSWHQLPYEEVIHMLGNGHWIFPFNQNNPYCHKVNKVTFSKTITGFLFPWDINCWSVEETCISCDLLCSGLKRNMYGLHHDDKPVYMALLSPLS